jgi:hypothetical protein
MKATLLFFLFTLAACIYAAPAPLAGDNTRGIESTRSALSILTSAHPSWKLISKSSIDASSAGSTPSPSFFSGTQLISNAMFTGLWVVIAIETTVLIVFGVSRFKGYHKGKGIDKDAECGEGNGPEI